MNPSHFSLGIKDQTGFYEVSLHEVSKSSKDTVLISGKNYKILGSEPAISKLRFNMTNSSFENVSEFTASVQRNVKSQEKTEVVFQEIIGSIFPSLSNFHKVLFLVELWFSSLKLVY